MKKGSRLTQSQIIAAEETASEVYDQKLTEKEGIRRLVEEYGLKDSTAGPHINNYRLMIRGEVFKRTLGKATIIFFLSKILERRGSEAHALALRAVEQHIDYYESLGKGKQPGLRKIIQEIRRDVAPVEFTDYVEQFAGEIQKSLRDSPDSRAKRIEKADKAPAKIPVISFAFVRNPDVVAEVLIRAKGKCERCKNAAPFKRKTDDSPYLEVHHTVQLSQGGEDTVENAQALCPNCHRLLHHGNLSDPEAAIENVSGTNN